MSCQIVHTDSFHPASTVCLLCRFRSVYLIHLNQTLLSCFVSLYRVPMYIKQSLIKGKLYLQTSHTFLVFHVSCYRWRLQLYHPDTKHQKANYFISRSNFEYFGVSLLTRGLPLLAAANIASREVPVAFGTLF